MDNKVVLVIMDGIAIRAEKQGNAVKIAKPKFLNKAMKKFPTVLLSASQEEVGLPSGQFGNSEVGHQNIGAGRRVLQELLTINNAIANGSFFDNKVLNETLDLAKSKRKALHIIGIVSNGGVHGNLEHIYALIEQARRKKFKRLYVHAITDGRDTLPNISNKFIIELSDKIKDYGVGQLVTISGRYYAMDRENNYDRTQLAYNAIVNAKGDKSKNLIKTLNTKLKNGETDEFIKPIVLEDYEGFNNGDFCLFANFRADRARQLSYALADPNFNAFERKNIFNLITMTSYGKHLDNLKVPCLYPQKEIKNNLTQVVTQNDGKVLKIAETTKYAHVTYFFNGLREKPYDNEDRIIFDSDKVATFDLKPEMQAENITNACIEAIKENDYDLIVLNFANGDMVGHTGNLNATIQAVRKVDKCLKRIYKNIGNYQLLITADHGNAELMVDNNKQVITSHTTNLVPFIVCDKNIKLKKGDFALSNIAPTVLQLMNIQKPKEMSDESMILA